MLTDSNRHLTWGKCASLKRGKPILVQENKNVVVLIHKFLGKSYTTILGLLHSF